MADAQPHGSAEQQRWSLVLPHREHLLAIARRRCASDEDAEDVVQEAMLRVAQFEQLDPARVEAMLTSVTTRLAVDLHRARERARRYQPRLVHVPEQQAPPDEAALDTGEALWLAARVEQLPEREREVFRQRVAGYSVGEAAARLSLSYKAVESAFTRARGRMRAWAIAGSLLVLGWLRRLRQRPGSSALASLAMVSAGLLIATSLPGRPPAGAHRDTPDASAPHAWAAGDRPELVSAQVAPRSDARQQPPPPRGAHANARPSPSPTSGVTRHDIFHATAPGPSGPNGPLGIDISSYDNAGGNFVADTVSCIQHESDNINSGTVGCPPPQ